MLQCWQEDPEERPSFNSLRSSFSAMLLAGTGDVYIDLRVNENAPYYQVKDEERRERSDSSSSEDSVSSIDKKKKKEKVTRKRTNPYVPTPEQQQGGGGGQGEEGGEEGYIAMQSAGSVQQGTPRPLGIPISQLIPSSSSSAQTPGERQLTPIDESETVLDNRTTNPYVTEPSEVADGSLVASSVPLVTTGTNGVYDDVARESSLEPLSESTHL